MEAEFNGVFPNSISDEQKMGLPLGFAKRTPHFGFALDVMNKFGIREKGSNIGRRGG
jgi:hypothetical protein